MGMSGDFSVKGILTAQDKNMSSTFKSVLGTTETLGSKLKSGIGFGALMSIGSGAMRFLGNETRLLMAEINDTNSAWKSFTSNMQMSGMGQKQINATKKDLQKFAARTVYSSKDMASTYAQLYAVDKKTSTALVKGFGAVAAASENPRQAMKTLSTQATQMAAKPTVAWQDFKLMLEQSPAGLAQVAKAMGVTTGELVKNVQAGKVKTEDFFKAMEQMSKNKTLMGMAQQYKTVGEAADGLRATIATGLAPAFDALSGGGVKLLSSLMDTLATRMEILNKAFAGVGKAWGEAFRAVGKELGKLNDSKKALADFKDGATSAASAMKSLAAFTKRNAKAIALFIDNLPTIIGGLLALKAGLKVYKYFDAMATATDAAASALPKAGKAAGVTGKRMLTSAKGFMAMGAGALLIAGAFYVMAHAAIDLAKAGKPAIAIFAGMGIALVGLGAGMVIMTKALGSMSAAKMTKIAVAFVAFGAAVLLVAAGMYVMASAAAKMAEGGGMAIASFAVMGIAIGVLLGAFVLFGKQLTAAIPAMLAFGVTVLLIGAGIGIAAAGISLLVNAITGLIYALPVAAQYGMDAALGILAMAGACVALTAAVVLVAAGVAILGIALVAMGLMAVATGALLLAFGVMAMTAGALLLVFGTMAIVAGGMLIIFGGFCTLAAGGVVILKGALMAVNSSMKSIAKNAQVAGQAISSMKSGVNAVKAGLNAIGDYAQAGMNRLKSAFSGAAASAASSGRAVGTGFSSGLSAGLSSAVARAYAARASINAALAGGGAMAYSCGVYIGAGLANGMASQLGRVRSIASSLAAAADIAIRKKAQIASPSKVAKENGAFIGEGLALGIEDKIRRVKTAAEGLLSPMIAQTSGLAFAGAMNASLSDEYEYAPSARYEIHVHSEIDGREVARATVDDLTELQDKKKTRKRRERGKV